MLERASKSKLDIDHHEELPWKGQIGFGETSTGTAESRALTGRPLTNTTSDPS
jgi:hypothetical protein